MRMDKLEIAAPGATDANGALARGIDQAGAGSAGAHCTIDKTSDAARPPIAH